MVDGFKSEQTELNSPAVNAFSITPHDTNELANVTRAIYVGASGDLKITTGGGDTVTFPDCIAGSVLPIRVKKVFATGSAGGAGDYIGLY